MSPDRRSWHRFDTLCPIRIESAAHGETVCVARNVSEGGIFIETREPLPIGTAVAVTFEAPEGATPIVARGEVKHHYFFHYGGESRTRSLTGMGVRFSTFEADERDEFPEWAFGVAPTPQH